MVELSKGLLRLFVLAADVLIAAMQAAGMPALALAGFGFFNTIYVESLGLQADSLYGLVALIVTTFIALALLLFSLDGRVFHLGGR